MRNLLGVVFALLLSFSIPVQTILLTTGAVAIVATQSGCDKKTQLQYAEESVAALREAEPLLQALGLPADKINNAISAGDKLVAWLKNPDSSTDPKHLASTVLKALGTVIEQTNVIHDPVKKTLVLAFIGIANIALHHLVDNISDGDAVGAGPELMKFRAKKPWRCRSSQDGQYKKMEYCTKHPDVSQVETN